MDLRPLFYYIKRLKGDMNYMGVILMNMVNDRWFDFIFRCCSIVNKITMNVSIYYKDTVSIFHKDNMSIFHKMMCQSTISIKYITSRQIRTDLFVEHHENKSV